MGNEEMRKNPAPLGEPKEDGRIDQERRSKKQGARDPLALGVFGVALMALCITGYFAVGQLRGGIALDPAKAILEWADELDRYGWEFFSRIPGITVSRGKPVQDAERHVRKAYQLYTQNRLNEAVEECGKAIRLDPQNAKAHYWRGRIHIKAEKYEQALQDFRAAVKVRPDYREAHDNLGWLYEREKRYDEALSHLTKSIELAPDNAWAYYHRALVFHRKGRPDRALEDAKRACELKNQDGCRLYEEYKGKKS